MGKEGAQLQLWACLFAERECIIVCSLAVGGYVDVNTEWEYRVTFSILENSLG